VPSYEGSPAVSEDLQHIRVCNCDAPNIIEDFLGLVKRRSVHKVIADVMRPRGGSS